MVAGYSGTPLARKLGISANSNIWLSNAPDNYKALLEPLPDEVSFPDSLSLETDIVHLFSISRLTLAEDLNALRKSIRNNCAIWVSWPKKSSKIQTDITEDVIRAIALPIGLVDIKVCAIDATWSGLKLVIRRELR